MSLLNLPSSSFNIQSFPITYLFTAKSNLSVQFSILRNLYFSRQAFCKLALSALQPVGIRLLFTHPHVYMPPVILPIVLLTHLQICHFAVWTVCTDILILYVCLLFWQFYVCLCVHHSFHPSVHQLAVGLSAYRLCRRTVSLTQFSVHCPHCVCRLSVVLHSQASVCISSLTHLDVCLFAYSPIYLSVGLS